MEERCSKCQAVGGIGERYVITRVPGFLVLKINRFHDLGKNRIMYKIDLDIPVNKLKLLGERFDLISVVTEEHLLEDEEWGYWKVFNRNLITNEWYCFSNALVFKV
jgi:hypothetical protein